MKNNNDLDYLKDFLNKSMLNEKRESITFKLFSLMESILTSSNARSFKYMISYYGLNGSPALTLEGIGEKLSENKLTRERVRQIIDNGLRQLLKAEDINKILTPYKDIQNNFKTIINKTNLNFTKLNDFEDLISLGGISLNKDKRGVIAFLNDAGIKQVVYRGEHYIYPENVKRNSAIINIQSVNKKQRRSETLKKMEDMAKTVTYVPVNVKEKLHKMAQKKKIHLNRMYENIIIDFIDQKPFNESSDFVKTQSWKARRGKADWSQIGIYIDKSIYEKAQELAKKIKPTKISNMAFICQAFIWAANN